MSLVPPHRARRRAAATVTLALGLALTLHLVGAPSSEAPPLGAPSDLGAWVERHGTVVAAMSALRAGALGAALYVAVLAVVALAATLRPTGRPVALLERLTPRALRGALGLGLAGTLALPVASPPASAASDPPPVLVWVGPSTEAPAGPPTAPATSPPEMTERGDGTATAPSTPLSPPLSPPHDRWTVQPGDHFWSIAETVVRGDGAAAPASEVARYWRELVEANRHQLTVPGDADLVLPGQQLVLPPLRRAPGS